MLIGIPKESRNNENRVAITPEILKKIIKLGYEVQIEKSAGLKSSFPDQLYLDQGASVVESKEIWKSSDIILKVNSPTDEESSNLSGNQTLISFFGLLRMRNVLSYSKKIK